MIILLAIITGLASAALLLFAILPTSVLYRLPLVSPPGDGNTGGVALSGFDVML